MVLKHFKFGIDVPCPEVFTLEIFGFAGNFYSLFFVLVVGV